MAEKTLVYRINFDGLEAQAAAIGKVDGELTALNQTIRDQRSGIKQLQELNQQGTQAYADLSEELGKNIVQQRATTKAKGDLIRETQNEAKVLKENEGSIVSLRAQLSNLTKEYNNLTKAERESAKGKDVQNQAKAISDELKKLEGAIGNNTRNVGNYGSALKDVAGQINIAGVNIGGLVNQFQSLQSTLQALVTATQASTLATESQTVATEAQTVATNASTGALGKAANSLKAFRVALIATGIGAIVVIIGTLVAAFLSTQKGIDAATRAFKPLQVAFERIVGFIQNVALNAFESPQKALKSLGDFIVGQFTNRLKALQTIFTETVNAAKNLGGAFKSAITGDFSGASDALTAAGNNVKNVGSNFVDLQTGVQGTIDKLSEFTAETIKTANKISDLEIKVRELTRTNTALIAGYNEEIEALKAIAADTSKTAAAREIAGKQAIALIEQRRLAQLELIDAEIQLLELNQSLNDTDAQGLQDLEELRAKRNQVNKEAAAGGKEVTGQINAAKQAQVQANKAALDQLEKIRQDNSLSLIKDTEERTRKELEIQNKANLESVDLLKVSEKLKQQIRDAFNEQLRISIEQLNDEIKRQELDAQFELNQLKIEGEKIYISDRFALGQIELQQLIDKQKRELEIFEGSETQKKVLLQQQLNERNALIKENDAAEANAQKEKDESDAAQRQKKADEEKAKRDEEKQKQIEQVQEIQNVIASVGQSLDILSEARTQKIENEAQREIDAIKKLPVAEEEKEKRILAVETKAAQDKAQIEKKNADRQKAFAVTQALISGALAIVQSLANTTLPFPLSLAGPISIGIATAAQIAAISAQKFAEGGEIPMDGGFITGNSHSQGGVKFSAGGRLMEAEGGEIIVNKGIQKRPDFVRAISQMNYMTGGKKFETGGIVAPVFSAAGASLASQEQNVGQGFTFEIPPIQVLNNVVDTTSQQSSIIQIQNQTSIGG